jgi:phosphoserine phosphatase
MDHAEEYRLWAEQLKAKMDHAEYRLEQLRRKRGHLAGSEHEDLYRRPRKGEGIMKLARQEKAKIDQSMFAIDVLRELEELDVASSADQGDAS